MEEKSLARNEENAVIDVEYDRFENEPVVEHDRRVDLFMKLQAHLQRRDLSVIADDEKAMERFLNFQKNIFRIMVLQTRPRDWIDRDGFPELQGSGAWAIRAALQISFFWTKKPEIETKGGHRYASCEGIFFHPQLGIVEEMGSRSTEDKFVSDWDDNNLKKCAVANLFSRGMTRLVGMSRLTWEDLGGIDAKYNADAAAKIKHDKGSRGGSREKEWDEDIKIKAEWIHYWIKEITGGKPETYKPFLVSLSQFNDVPGVERVSELTSGRVKVVYEKAQKEYDKFLAKNGENNGTNDDPGPDNYYGDGELAPDK